MYCKIRVCAFVAVMICISAVNAQESIDLKKIPPSAELFAKGLVSTGMSERDFALSPDGNEIYYTVQVPSSMFHVIVMMKKDQSGYWSKPEVASFSGHFSDLEPAFSVDGKRLYFSSNRPVSGDKAKDFDIWWTERNNGIWSEPKLITELSTPGNEFYPSVTANGNLYFTAEYKNGIGKEDIFFAKWENGHFLAPIPLDTNVNSKTYEFNAFISPDEQFIIFSSYGRSDDKGRGDLYISMKNTEGKWQPAKNLSILNSEKLDYCPFVSFDKKILFFTSEKSVLPSNYNGKGISYAALQKISTEPMNGGGNIYWIDFDVVLRSLK